jgi:hypothetical protein
MMNTFLINENRLMRGLAGLPRDASRDRVDYTSPMRHHEHMSIGFESMMIASDSPENIRALGVWLNYEAGAQGQVHKIDEPPASDELGGTSSAALLAVLAPGGVAVGILSGVFAWLRTRTSSVRIRLVRSDGSEVELEASSVGRLPPAELPEIVNELASWAGGGSTGQQLTANMAGKIGASAHDIQGKVE